MTCRASWIGALAVLAVPPVSAASFYLCTDVPTDLGATTWLESEVVRSSPSGYSLALELPTGTAIDALHRMDSGDWIFSVSTPADLGGTVFDPRDVIRLSGGIYTRLLDGASAGIPEGTDLDAVLFEGGDQGNLVFSLDLPAELAGTLYEPADLVRYQAGAISSAFDASAATPPIGSDVNVVAADVRGSLKVLSFDVPVDVGSITAVPGDLVAWNGSAFELFQRDPSWPSGSLMSALAFLAEPAQPPSSIRVARSAQGADRIEVRWQPSCSAGAEDYGIYAGELGTWYSHVALDCTDDDRDLFEVIQSSAGNRYFLVVARNSNDEGSYGTDSRGQERPRGGGACAPTQALSACP